CFLVLGWHGRKPADFREANSKRAWFRPSQRTRRKDGSGSRPSLALFGRVPAKDCRQTNANWKSGPQRGPPTGFGCFASVALAKSPRPSSQRSVRGGIKASVRNSRCRGGKIYCPLAAALSPSLIASASLTYFPFFVLP